MIRPPKIAITRNKVGLLSIRSFISIFKIKRMKLYFSRILDIIFIRHETWIISSLILTQINLLF